jgi:hypothetical protein
MKKFMPFMFFMVNFRWVLALPGYGLKIGGW